MNVDQEKNVISLFSKAEPGVAQAGEGDPSEPRQDFDAIMKKNRQVAERLKQERLKNNRSVLKSYRIK